MDERQKLREELMNVAGKNALKNIIENSRGSVRGSIIGGVIMFLAAVRFKQSKAIFVVVGTVAGGYIGHGILKKLNEKNEKG